VPADDAAPLPQLFLGGVVGLQLALPTHGEEPSLGLDAAGRELGEVRRLAERALPYEKVGVGEAPVLVALG
jgi:hypothetical protein